MTHNQRWFEMVDVISNRHGDGEWTLLWAYDVIRTGEEFSAPYCEEIFRVRSIFAPMTNKMELFSVWHDIDSDNVYPCVDRKHYCKPGTYYLDSSIGREAGEYGVYSYITARGETSELIINPDLLAALGLVRSGDSWVRPSECDKEVIKIERNNEDKIVRISVRTELLKDYLCARGMGLYVEEFRHRQEQAFDGNQIGWTRSPYIEEKIARDGNGRYEWKGWMFKHEDEHSWDDVQAVKGPILSLPSYYRIEGQLWKQFWVIPGKSSTRVADDNLGLTFYVMPNGEQHEISPVDDDEYGHVYLFFNIGIVRKLQNAGLSFKWDARDVFTIQPPSGEPIMCGISTKSKIFAISADIARQDGWLQLLLHSENVEPEEMGGIVGCELFQNQMLCEYLRTKAPENEFPRLMKVLSDVFKERTGVSLWQEIDTGAAMVASVSRFSAIDQDGYIALAKHITRAMIERLDVTNLKKIINGKFETAQLGSIGLLACALKSLDVRIDGEATVSFMRKINSLRQVDAHLMSKIEMEKRIECIPMPIDSGWLERGARLIEYANEGLQGLIEALS